MQRNEAPKARRPFVLTATLAVLGVGTLTESAAQGAAPKYTVTPVPFEGSAWFLTAGKDALWIPNPKIGSVSRLDPATLKATPIWVHEAWTAPLGPNRFSVINAAVTDTAVWVADEGTREVVRIDPKTNTVAARISLGDMVPLHVAVGEGAVWVVSRRTGHLVRIDPATNKVTSAVELPSPNGLVVAHGSVWVTLTSDTAIARVDPKTGKVTATVKLESAPGPLPDCGHCVLSVTSDGTVVWALGSAGRVWRIDPASNAVRVLVGAIESKDLKSKKIGRVYAQGIAVGEGALWVGLGWGSERVARIDPKDGRVELVEIPGILEMPYERAHVAFAFGAAWVSGDQHNTVWRVTRTP